MGDSILGTFRIKQSLWDEFKLHCSQNGDSASSRLIKLMMSDMGKSETLTPLDNDIDKRIESYLESHLDKFIDKMSRTDIDDSSIQRLDSRIDSLREEISYLNDEVKQAIAEQVSELFHLQIGELKGRIQETLQRNYNAENNSKLIDLMEEQITLAKQVENLSRLFDNVATAAFRPLFDGINQCREKLGLRPFTLNEVSFSEFKRMSKGKHSSRERTIALFEEKTEDFKAELTLSPENDHQTDLTPQDNNSPVEDADPPSELTAIPENEPLAEKQPLNDSTSQNDVLPIEEKLDELLGEIEGQSEKVTKNNTDLRERAVLSCPEMATLLQVSRQTLQTRLKSAKSALGIPNKDRSTPFEFETPDGTKYMYETISLLGKAHTKQFRKL